MIIRIFISISIVVLIFISNIKVEAQENHNLDSLISSSRLLLKQSKPDNSIKLLFVAINSDKISGDTLALCNILLAEAYRQKREYDKGKDILFRELETTHLSNYNKAYLYNRLAALFAEGGTSESRANDLAITYSDLSIVISSKHKYDNLKCISYNELGFAYNKLGDTDKSKYYLELALQGFIEQSDLANAMHTSINLSNTYYALGDIPKAITLIDEAINIGVPNKQKNLYMRLYLQKADFLSKEGNYKLAYEFLKKSRNIQRDFYHDRINMQINEMSAAYDLQLKEARILEVEKENKIERQQTRFLIFALLASLIIIAFLVFSFRLRRKFLIQKRELVKAENINLKKDLEFKNKELVTNALTMAQQMEYNINISERLKAIMPIGNEKVKHELMQTIKALSSNQNSKVWEEFETRFSKVHDEFYKKLRVNYPQLTPTEIKICAFLKLNMSTKDIASLTNRSPRTIENTRQSIRKKLAIDGETNLVNFLLDL